MYYAESYQSCVDWGYERDVARSDAIEKRANELEAALQNDRAAMAEAWDDHTCHELTGNEVAQYVRDNDEAGLMRAVRTLVKLGITKIAEDRAEREVGA
jgi:hypothetical protein